MQQSARWPPRQTAGSFSATSACGCRRAVAAPRADRDDRAGKGGRCKGGAGGGRGGEEEGMVKIEGERQVDVKVGQAAVGAGKNVDHGMFSNKRRMLRWRASNSRFMYRFT